MNKMLQSVRCLLLPLKGTAVLLPNAAVAEIITYQAPDSVPGSPNWFLGLLAWRNQVIPMISYEAIVGGEPAGIGRNSRIVVLKAVGEGGELGFYAIVTSGFPRLMVLGSESLDYSEEQVQDNELIIARLDLDGTNVDIPDLDRLEQVLVASKSA